MSGDDRPAKVKRPWWLLAMTGLLSLTVVVLALVLVVGLSQWAEPAQTNAAASTTVQHLEEQNRDLRARLYAAHIQLAYKAWEEANVSRLQQLLNEHRPQPGQEDLRHFEWYYLQRLCHAEHLRIRGAGDVVVSLAAAPNGRWLAAGCADGTVQIWDANTGVAGARIQKHSGSVRGLAFSPDSGQLATGSADGTLQVWDPRTGNPLRPPLCEGSEEIRCVAFHPDGKHLVAAVVPLAVKGVARSGGRVVVWGDRSPKPLFSSAEWPVALWKIAFNPSGTHLAVATGAQGKGAVALKVWEVQCRPQFTLQERWALPGQEVPGIFGLAWSPDGTVLASSGVDRKVRLWNGGTGQLERVLEGHQDFVTAVAFSPDGKQLASGGWDQTVRVWDATTGVALANLRGHVTRLVSVLYLPDGKIVSAAGKLKQGYEIKVWDADAGQEVPPRTQRLHNVDSLAFRADGQRLVCGCWEVIGELKVWNTIHHSALHTWPAHAGRILGVAFSPDGRRIASAGLDGKVKVWNADTFENQLALDGPEQLTVCVAFSPDGRWLLGGGKAAGSGELWCWDVRTGQRQQRLAVHGKTLDSLAFSRDGQRLVTGGSDGHVKVWDVSTEDFKKVATFTAEEGQKVFDAVFNPAGTQVASAHWDQSVRVWSVEDGKEVLRLKGHEAPVYSVVFHPDGSRLLSRDRRGTIKVWDAKTGQELLSVADREPTRGFGRLALSPDGQFLAVSGAWGARPRLWDARPLER